MVGGVEVIDSDAKAWEVANRLAPHSKLSLRSLFLALTDHLEPEVEVVPVAEDDAPTLRSAV